MIGDTPYTTSRPGFFALRTTVAALSPTSLPTLSLCLGSIARHLLGLNVGKMHATLLGAHDDGADARNCLAPARLHITEHNHPAGTQITWPGTT
jgi:hypothetical protein